ncbi:MAG TPA: TldD/PmbA family protein [Gemmatimonadales bacterium]|nr:TldD/PmbA family protein [Gemmatimonadales bacterium]
MESRITDALKASRADYTEIRIERTWVTTVALRGRRLEAAHRGVDQGAFIRCFAAGRGWGVVTTTDLDRLATAVARAHELSLLVPVERPITLAPVPPHQADDLPELEDDPRDMALTDKRALAERLNGELLGLDRRITETQFAARDEVTERWYGNSEGTLVHDLRADASIAAVAVARENGLVERAVGSWSARGGWRALADAAGPVRGLGERAIARLGARRVRAGTIPVVLDPRAAGALIHAAVGHRCEGDAPDALPLGARIGSPWVSIGDDGNGAGLRGAAAWDAEGTPTQNTTLIQAGVVIARLHSRESAARAGAAPTGSARAGSYRHVPAARMSNLYLASGQGTRAELMAPIPAGLFIADARAAHAEGDRVRLVAEAAWIIRRGELAEPVRDVVLRGRASDLLGAVDAVSGDFRWSEAAAACSRSGCGLLAVGDGAPHVRLRAGTVFAEGA